VWRRAVRSWRARGLLDGASKDEKKLASSRHWFVEEVYKRAIPAVSAATAQLYPDMGIRTRTAGYTARRPRGVELFRPPRTHLILFSPCGETRRKLDGGRTHPCTAVSTHRPVQSGRLALVWRRFASFAAVGEDDYGMRRGSRDLEPHSRNPAPSRRLVHISTSPLFSLLPFAVVAA
jgi:hypothetical protein